MLEHWFRMSAGRRAERPHDTLIELLGIRAPANEVQEAPWIEIVGQMQEVELLSYDSDHPGQCRSHRVGSWNTPLLIQLFIVYFGTPYLLGGIDLFPIHVLIGGVDISGAVLAGIVALGVNEGAYMSEIVRAGILSVDHGLILPMLG